MSLNQVMVVYVLILFLYFSCMLYVFLYFALYVFCFPLHIELMCVFFRYVLQINWYQSLDLYMLLLNIKNQMGIHPPIQCFCVCVRVSTHNTRYGGSIHPPQCFSTCPSQGVPIIHSRGFSSVPFLGISSVPSSQGCSTRFSRTLEYMPISWFSNSPFAQTYQCTLFSLFQRTLIPKFQFTPQLSDCEHNIQQESLQDMPVGG